ncbi:hypothetical protein [Spirilliplanes yamanashiensis]|uniref:hypothetical protein n=1 Tax=Spirilliplanes yamanashiensis TaxID=42233 RepID=UPI00194F2BE6|nr:hypothetical protein [Spirilliplanes yamanashiensis]MDP9816017.1 hypothetical protein [Spirilliplanes yamanashiensis]
MAATDAPALYIAHDDDTVIVSALPLTVAGGRAETFVWGKVVEISPADAPAVPATARQVRGLGVVVIVGGFGLNCAGFQQGLLVGLLGLVLVLVGFARGVAVRPGVIAAPQLQARPEQHHVLVHDADREVFSDAVELGQRASATWPLLGDLIDVAAAEWLLTHALLDLAGALEQRQELRELRGDVAGHVGRRSPADPQVRDLSARLAAADVALAGLDDDIERRVGGLRAVAVAGEEFVRDEEVRDLTRRVDEAIGRLASVDSPGSQDSGAELAGHLEAVLRAYRELADQRGSDGEPTSAAGV